MHLSLVALLLGLGCSGGREAPVPEGVAHDADFAAASATDLLSAEMAALGYQSQTAIDLAAEAVFESEQTGCPAAVGDDTYEADGCDGGGFVWDGRATLHGDDLDALWSIPAPDLDLAFDAFSATLDGDVWAFDGTYRMDVTDETVTERIDLTGDAPGFASRLRTTVHVDCDVDADPSFRHARDCVIADGGEGEVDGLGAFGVSGDYRVETTSRENGDVVDLVTTVTGRIELRGRQTMVIDPKTTARDDGFWCMTVAIDGDDRTICWDPRDGVYTAEDAP